MGNYNPHAPIILGQEWVPIRDHDTALSPAVNSVELGHGFTLTQARQVGSGRFYVAERPQASASQQVFQVSVYPRGYENLSGPIRRVVIPVTSGTVTGASFTGASVAQALGDPADNRNLTVGSGSSPTDSSVDIYFGVNSFSQLLAGKRIVAVNLLYQISSTFRGDQLAFTLFVGPPTLQFFRETANSFIESTQIERWQLGEVGPFHASDPLATTERAPWTYEVLQRFEPTAANRIRAKFNVTADVSASVTMTYAALEVLFCEETRVAVGGAAFGSLLASNTFSGSANEYALGANAVPMRGLPSLNLSPVLAAGEYTVVVSSPNTGIPIIQESPYPLLNAAQQLYEIPPHPGVQVNIPSPAEDHVGDVFSTTTLMRLPQISLHASGAGTALTEPHAYGRQVAAQVFGSQTAVQNIYDALVGGTADYPWVRFYARRFGDTTVDLTLDSPDIPGSSVTVTADELDALPNIVDGWREITKRFDTPPSMGGVAGNPRWRWSAAGELAGSRWEIAAACAPAASGVPGLPPYQLAPTGQLTDVTYDPADAANVYLQWMPQGVGSAPVSGTATDLTTDAALLFSQDPPTPSGLAVTAQTQAVSGFAYSCSSPPCCIPSGIGYQALTWSATSLPSSGFGAYELQRYDPLVGDWQTIMLATSQATTGFNDYESRVGQTSVYRIRTYNVLNFYGLWSDQVSGSVESPGVTGACDDMTGALIFTSNEDQTGGLNAAYVMNWDRDPEETFSLPEANDVIIQRMYGRDGAVAFHGTERGLETFGRMVLIRKGAVDPKVLANTATLRDLAWADVPYICVRDDHGNRWFANVTVPDVRARDDGAEVMALVQITETNTDPSAVDP